MENVKGLILTSAAPLDDGLRKFNVLYFIFAVIGFIVGIIDAGFKEAIAWVFFGFVVGFVIKAVIADIMMRRMYLLAFNLPTPNISTTKLMQVIVRPLTSLGMTVEINSDGSPCITHGGIMYDLKINVPGNDTFSLCWGFSMAKSIFHRTYIPYYRQAVVSIGLIAFTIQEEINKHNGISV